MGRFFSFMKEQFEKIKKPPVSNAQSQKIVIRSRHDSHPTSDQNNVPEDIPKITIRGVNQRTPIASGTNIYRTEVDVQNTNLGGGITVNRQRKPGRCPLCATRGGIIENPGGRPRWKCPACDSTFN